MRKTELIKELEKKWKDFVDLPWPHMPPFSSDLNGPACDLMDQDTSVAGCISQIIEKGTLKENLWHVLSVDQDLTDRIAATNDPQTQEFLEYKAQLDECIRLAQVILDRE